jgi:hypothetical protein
MSSDEWLTPEDILDGVEKFFRRMIGFDPTCSPDSPAWGRAGIKLTIDDDALSMDRWPERGPAFVNMPYSNPPPYIDRAIAYYDDYEEPVVTLTNAATSTVWCQELLRSADFACFASPRIRFLRARLPASTFGAFPEFSPPEAQAKWRKAVAAEAALPTVFVGPRGVELVQPSSPRYENLICGFGGQFDDFLEAFGAFGTCLELYP